MRWSSCRDVSGRGGQRCGHDGPGAPRNPITFSMHRPVTGRLPHSSGGLCAIRPALRQALLVTSGHCAHHRTVEVFPRPAGSAVVRRRGRSTCRRPSAGLIVVCDRASPSSNMGLRTGKFVDCAGEEAVIGAHLRASDVLASVAIRVRAIAPTLGRTANGHLVNATRRCAWWLNTATARPAGYESGVRAVTP